ncbi:MAG: hypothetical protein WAT70_00885 [Rhizobiaceae bacterium]
MARKHEPRVAKDVSFARDILCELRAAGMRDRDIRGFAELAARVGNYTDEARGFWRSVAAR